MKAFLGLDTSCYMTSVAAVSAHGEILASFQKLLDVPTKKRGLQQSQAVFFHLQTLPGLVEQLCGALPETTEIAAVCASTKPRQAQASYMPVFCVGEHFGKSIASVLRVPFFKTDHQAGHLRAGLIDTTLFPDDSFLTCHLSGGTTEMLCKQRESIALIGGTADISAGQLVDRIGVALGLPFPAGPHFEELAKSGNAAQRLGVSVQSFNEQVLCHFSGAEAQVMRWIRNVTLSPQDIAAEVYALIARTIVRMIELVTEHTGMSDILLVGGVVSSRLLRQLISDRVRKKRMNIMLHFARPECSGDNAVGVALIGQETWAR